MNRKNTITPLSGITFEDIIAENESDLKTLEKDVEISQEKASRITEFEIIENYGTLSNRKNAITFSLVDWNGYKRYDIRRWNSDYSQPFKGISLSRDEMIILKDYLMDCTSHNMSDVKYVYESGKAKAHIYAIICNLSSTEIKETVWNKQLCLVDWGYGKKLDIRKWTDDYKKCSKGISLNDSEIETLRNMLCEINL